MARLNTKAKAEPKYTHEGAPAALHVTPEQQLRRTVLACLLWEDQFYEDGVSIAERIATACHKVPPSTVAELAVEARSKFHLRHVPLLLVRELARHADTKPGLVAELLPQVVQRPDEMAEFLAVYWATNGGKKTLPAGVKKGLAACFQKSKEWALAKYDRDGAIKLRDVLRLSHPKPRDAAQSAMFKRVKDRTLVPGETWETELSAGKDKKETFERLIREGKLGYLALLRNLRNMEQAGCDRDLVCAAIEARKGGAERVLPFRYVAAARAAPQFEKSLDKALLATIAGMDKLTGRTVVLVDVSGSMNEKLSAKSDLRRIDAACVLASMLDGDVRVWSFSNVVVEVPHRLGMAGVDAISRSQLHQGTRLGEAMDFVNRVGGDRLIVITDEQSHTQVPDPKFEKAYMINVASYQNGVGYGHGWVHIDGFSEQVLRYITEIENQR